MCCSQNSVSRYGMEKYIRILHLHNPHHFTKCNWSVYSNSKSKKCSYNWTLSDLTFSMLFHIFTIEIWIWYALLRFFFSTRIQFYSINFVKSLEDQRVWGNENGSSDIIYYPCQHKQISRPLEFGSKLSISHLNVYAITRNNFSLQINALIWYFSFCSFWRKWKRHDIKIKWRRHHRKWYSSIWVSKYKRMETNTFICIGMLK